MSIKVIELFAGVGGFRLGLEGYPRSEDSPFEVIWSNQWEPGKLKQYANLVYANRWPNAVHCGENIESVIENSFDTIPDHDMLVGGFPCQDYSVATTLSNSKGLRGKKGVLWWSIEAILRKKEAKRPKYLLLENVDRLLKSPSTQRGRDFAIMLSSLNALDYAVEWRVINAADYGMPQRRRRVFIVGYHRSTNVYQKICGTERKADWITDKGIMAAAFPVKPNVKKVASGSIDPDIQQVSDTFNLKGGLSPFASSGLMVDGTYWTTDLVSDYSGNRVVLEDVLIPTDQVPESFFITEAELNRENGWKYLKGPKKIERTNAEGHRYVFSEGGLIFPDPLDGPSRTIITGEGGAAASRTKHVIYRDGRYRRLVPIELERLNMFPDDHTKLSGVSDQKRAFFMGNALVVGVVHRIGRTMGDFVEEPIPESVG